MQLKWLVNIPTQCASSEPSLQSVTLLQTWKREIHFLLLSHATCQKGQGPRGVGVTGIATKAIKTIL